jgi:hypothetical protein
VSPSPGPGIAPRIEDDNAHLGAARGHEAVQHFKRGVTIGR